MEKCDRCGEVDEDRRTLKMACFYAMEEMKLPFKKVEVFDIDERLLKRTKKRRIAIHQQSLPDGGMSPKKRIPYYENVVRASGRVEPRDLYTLRVCKTCRAEWMDAIKNWFESVPPPVPSSDSGIFIRSNGATIEISEEQWDRMHPGVKPVRVVRR
jgi:hypothetical protein